MSGARAPEAWQCDRCGDVHDDEDDARACCAPDVIAGYTCPLCATFHTGDAAALECCGWDPDKPIPPTALELEAAGQLRLIP